MLGARARAAIACGVLAAWLQGCGQPEDEKKAKQPQDKAPPDQPAAAGTAETPAAPAAFAGTSWKDCEGVWTYSMTLTGNGDKLQKVAYVVVEKGEVTKAAFTAEAGSLFEKMTPQAGKECKLKVTKSNEKGNLWQANDGGTQLNFFVLKDELKVKAGWDLKSEGTLDKAQSTATKLVWTPSGMHGGPGEAVKASDAERPALLAKIDAAPECKSEPCKGGGCKPVDELLTGLLELAPAAAAQHAPGSHAAVSAKGSTTRDEPESSTKSTLKPRSWAVNAGGAKLIED